MQQQSYRIVLLPGTEVVARFLTIGEARAWIDAYNAIMRDESHEATIAEETKRP